MGNVNIIPNSYTSNTKLMASNSNFKLLRILCSPVITVNLIFVGINFDIQDNVSPHLDLIDDISVF